jgi:hypothetical protein
MNTLDNVQADASIRFPQPGMPPHRKVLLWMTIAALMYAALQVGWRVWLLKAGEPAVGEVTVAADSCSGRHRANCYLGRAVVNPRIEGHAYRVTKLSGGRFYSVGETVEMRVYPHKRMYLAAVYTPIDWLLGPIRTGAVALLWLFAAAMPARRRTLWIAPMVLSLFLVFG